MNPNTFGLVKGFGALTTPSSLQAYNVDQLELVAALLQPASHYRSYPPTRAYRRKFWKWFITELENQNEEVDTQIYDEYLSLLNENDQESGGSSSSSQIMCKLHQLQRYSLDLRSFYL